jgi:hypothetical protein
VLCTIDLQGVGHGEMREVTAARARRSPPSPTTHPRSLSHVVHRPGGLQPLPQPRRDPRARRRGLIVVVAGLKPYNSPPPCHGAWQPMWRRAATPFGSISAVGTPKGGCGRAVGDTGVRASARAGRGGIHQGAPGQGPARTRLPSPLRAPEARHGAGDEGIHSIEKQKNSYEDEQPRSDLRDAKQ